MMETQKIQEQAYYLTKTLMHAVFKNYLDEQQLMQIMQTLELKQQDEHIFFLTQLSLLLRKYPDTLFTSNDTRGRFIQVIQTLLDSKILEENN